jgi:hypothetical protein
MKLNNCMGNPRLSDVFQVRTLLAGNTNRRGTLSTFELLIKLSCFCKDVKKCLQYQKQAI